MKKQYFIPILLLFCTVWICSCNEDESLNVDDEIFGLGGEIENQSELDKWLYTNYVQGYNINVKYKWDSFELSSTAQLVPIHRSLVKPAMDMIRKVWFDPYEKTAGSTFVKQITPKNIVLVGSPEYNEDGTVKLGQAEGANKITLYDCNAFSPSDAVWLQSLLHTIEHEFAHIMHQTRSYDKSFKSISAGTYNPTGWYNIDEVTALVDGFLSPYSMSGVDEDFVEIISLIMVYGPEWLQVRYDVLDLFINLPPEEGETPDDIRQRLALSARAAKGLERLDAKIQAVTEYMKNTWGVQFFDMEGGDKGLVGEVQAAIEQVLAENAGVNYNITDDEQ